MRTSPSILFNNIFDPISRKEKIVLDYYKQINELNFYESYETRLIFDNTIRKEYANFIRENKLNSTIWLTSNLSNTNHNLRNINRNERKKAINFTKNLIDLCAESETNFIGLTSGKRIGNSSLSDQQDYFSDSLFVLLDYIKQYNGMKLLLEPLDVDADKKHTIGYTETVKKLADKVQKAKLNEYFTVCVDTAHIALNKEDVLSSMEILSPYSQRVHLSNAVLNEEDELYGDKHLPMGEPGFLTIETGKKIINRAKNLFFSDETVYIAVEVRGEKNNDLFKLEEDVRDFLNNVIV